MCGRLHLSRFQTYGSGGAANQIRPAGGEWLADRRTTLGGGGPVRDDYGLLKSGTVIEPSSASGDPGLCATSQAWPSGSMKNAA